MRYPVVFFDADDTLFDFEKTKQVALDALFAEAGFPSSEALKATYEHINRQLWQEFEQGWVDQASGPNLWLAGGKGYDAAGKRGLKIASGKGVKLIILPDSEVKRFQDAMAQVIETYKNTSLRPGLTGGQVIEAMGGLDN